MTRSRWTMIAGVAMLAAGAAVAEAHHSGVMFDDKASGCLKQAFDGAAVLYGTGNHFYLLTEASSMDANECRATALVMGPQAWANLVDAGVAALGCENID